MDKRTQETLKRHAEADQDKSQMEDVMSVNCKTHRRCGDKAIDGSCMRDAECENQMLAGSDKAKLFNATDLSEQTIKDQAAEMEQLKAQNMAMSEAMKDVYNYFWNPDCRSPVLDESDVAESVELALATYQQTIEG